MSMERRCPHRNDMVLGPYYRPDRRRLVLKGFPRHKTLARCMCGRLGDVRRTKLENLTLSTQK